MPPSGRALVTETLEYGGGRRVTAYVPHERVENVVYAADGGWHIDVLGEAVDRTGRPTTMVVGVHGRPDDDGRLGEYVLGVDPECFDAHERFFVDDVSRWVRSRFGIALPAERVAVWGASLGAEFALAMGLRHPDVFGTVLAASPGAGYRPPTPLRDPVPRVYLVAGRQEPFFLGNARRWASALHDAEVDVVLRERDGEHGGEFWGAELPAMLAWAFGT